MRITLGRYRPQTNAPVQPFPAVFPLRTPTLPREHRCPLESGPRTVPGSRCNDPSARVRRAADASSTDHQVGSCGGTSRHGDDDDLAAAPERAIAPASSCARATCYDATHVIRGQKRGPKVRCSGITAISHNSRIKS